MKYSRAWNFREFPKDETLSALNGHNFLNNGPIWMISELADSWEPPLCRNMEALGAKIGQKGKFAKFSCHESFMLYSTSLEFSLRPS